MPCAFVIRPKSCWSWDDMYSFQPYTHCRDVTENEAGPTRFTDPQGRAPAIYLSHVLSLHPGFFSCCFIQLCLQAKSLLPLAGSHGPYPQHRVFVCKVPLKVRCQLQGASSLLPFFNNLSFRPPYRPPLGSASAQTCPWPCYCP